MKNAVLLLIIAFYFVLAPEANSNDSAPVDISWPLTGVNLSGMEFAYPFFPNEAEAAYYSNRGMKIIRLPVKWEYLQPISGQDFDRSFLEKMKKSISYIENHGMVTMIDIHNFGKYGSRHKITGNIEKGKETVRNTNTAGILPGHYIWGAGIPNGTEVLSVNSATQFTMSKPATYTGKSQQLLWGSESKAINSDGGPTYEDFAALWSRIASDKDFKSNPKIVFDLMNEPASIDAITMGRAAQSAIYAIRDAGANNWIMVEGGGSYASCGKLVKSGWGDIALTLSDPMNKLIFQCHDYLDYNHSGTHDTAVKGSGAKQLVEATKWARENRKKLFLGEFGIANTPSGMSENEAMLSYMNDNSDVWVGWTAWGAGPAWPENYFFKLDPLPPTRGESYFDRPQMKLLLKYKDLGN